jgi:hypothetical protein
LLQPVQVAWLFQSEETVLVDLQNNANDLVLDKSRREKTIRTAEDRKTLGQFIEVHNNVRVSVRFQ